MFDATVAECKGIFATPVPKEEKKEEPKADEAAKDTTATAEPTNAEGQKEADVPMEEPKKE